MSLVFKPKFYLKPKTEDEISQLLKQYGERARIIAGGTGIYEVAHRGLLSDVDALLDISGLGLDFVRREAGGVVIGACTTMSSLVGSKELKDLPALSAIIDALHAIQPTQVKNVATVAGALCTALPFFDLPVAFLCLGARVIISPGRKSLGLEDFIQGYFAVNLAPGEFVREVELTLGERPGVAAASAFKKFALTGEDWAIVNSGAMVSLDRDGRIVQARISFGGGVGEKPVLAKKTADSIVGISYVGEDSIKEVIDTAVPQDVETISDIRASSDYRMKIAKVMCRRAVDQACRRALGLRTG